MNIQLLEKVEQIVTSVGAVVARKPRVIDCLRKASRRSRSATDLSSHHAGVQCSACQTQLTIEHVLLLCPTWNAIRINHFTVNNLLDLFNQVTPWCIVDFIKEIGFYRRL
jgi:Zn finger protein HypA/HybF involved in hydrogenase expression